MSGREPRDWRKRARESHASAVVGCGGGEKKVRRCLKCRRQFQSLGNGERVCGDCKRTRDWQSGTTYGLTKSTRVRRDPGAL